jgi:hypothetical protein
VGLRLTPIRKRRESERAVRDTLGVEREIIIKIEGSQASPARPLQSSSRRIKIKMYKEDVQNDNNGNLK